MVNKKMINLSINNIKIEVPEGLMLTEVARNIGINIPTLCSVEGKHTIGACRVCIVEIEGFKSFVAACITPAQQGMKVYTNSKRLREARKTIIELLLSEHDGDCQLCERTEDCELHKLVFELGVSSVPYSGVKSAHHIDDTTPALIRNNSKCIKCRRCVTVCNEIQAVGALYPQKRGFNTVIGPAFSLNLADVPCVQCGQCVAICPVAAITEKSHIDMVWKALDDPNKYVIVQTAPAIRAALGECFGMEPGTLVTGKMVSALKQLGFNKVFDTNFGADLTIMEEGYELIDRLKKVLVEKENVPLPMFTSCSPGWIKFAEYFYPEFLPNLSTCKSPQQMFGAITKTYFANKMNINVQNIVMVSVMPCTAKKFEAQRPDMDSSGTTDVDYVITTRELGKMLKQANINSSFSELPNSVMDSPLGEGTGAADIFANTGGVMEAAIRTVYEVVTGKELPKKNLHLEPIMGLKGLKTAELKIEGTLPDYKFLEGITLKLAVVHTLKNAVELFNLIKNGEVFHFVEVMTCMGGCIGGGGQPRFTSDKIREKRMEAIYKEDENKALRKSHQNPEVIRLYKEFLGDPLGKISHHLLHTKYKKREKF
jgi:iron-only hydrogenase group A